MHHTGRAAEAQGKRQALAVPSHVNFVEEKANLVCLVLVHTQ